MTMPSSTMRCKPTASDTQWAGSTEWQGQGASPAVSLAWDWVVQADGEIRLLSVVPPRTNVQVIDPQGL